VARDTAGVGSQLHGGWRRLYLVLCGILIKMATHFSHLRGGSYNRTVVQFCSMEVHVAIGEGKYSWGE
jgi:hypothetical protein